MKAETNHHLYKEGIFIISNLHMKKLNHMVHISERPT